MRFENIALTGWSYEKGDKLIPIADLDVSEFVRMRNPVPGTYVYSDETKWEHCLQSECRKAARMAGIADNDIQLFLGVHNGYRRHPEGASPVAMAEFETKEAFMFDFSLGCASVVMAAQLSGLYMGQESIKNIVFASAQLLTQYSQNCSDGNCLFADSLGAMVFSKRKSGNLVKFAEVHSDAEFRDMFVFDENAMYSMQNMHKGKALTKFMINAFGRQLRGGCLAMKTMPKDLDYIALSCTNYASTRTILDAMSFPLERTGIECFKKVPHMGTNDLIFQIEHGIEQGMIKPGSKVLLAGTSLGFSIATMAIEWGEPGP